MPPVQYQIYNYPLVNIKKNYGKSPFLMAKLTISMAIFNSFLYVYQRVTSLFIMEQPIYPHQCLVLYAQLHLVRSTLLNMLMNFSCFPRSIQFFLVEKTRACDCKHPHIYG